MQLRDLFDDVPAEGKSAFGPEVEALLSESIDVMDDWQRAEHLLLSAQARLPERLEISVALYKMYAYSGRHREALTLIDSVLQKAAQREKFPADFRRLSPESAGFDEATGATRLYLYSLKARGFVLLRRGAIEPAHEVLSKLSELDPQDQVGGSVVLLMAQNLLEHGDDPAN